MEEYKAGCHLADLKKKKANASEIDKAEKAYADVRNKLDARKNNLRAMEGFAEAEELWDGGIDLTQLNKEEMRLLREDLQIRTHILH